MITKKMKQSSMYGSIVILVLGKKIDVPVEPKAPTFEEKVKFMRVETNLVLYLKEERILFHQMIFPVQKKHVCLCLHHLQNCSIISILDVVNSKRKVRLNLQWCVIDGQRFEGTVKQISVNNKKK